MSVESYEERIIEKGLKNTKHRKLILEILDETKKPVTAEELFLLMKEKGLNPCLSTVYRTLEVFENKDLIIKSSSLDDGKARYEWNSQEHKHHVVCTNCHKIQYINECPFIEMERTLKKNIGFEVTGHKLEIYGQCKDCQGH